MSEFVKTSEEIIENLEVLNTYRTGDDENTAAYRGLISRGKNFVAVKQRDGYIFAPSKFAGYVNNGLHHFDLTRSRDGKETDKILDNIIGPRITETSLLFSELMDEFLAYCGDQLIDRTNKANSFWLIDAALLSDPKYYWTKVWGQPGDPSEDALLFNARSYQNRAHKLLNPGDIVVYLTSDASYADPNFKGRVSGAVEIAGELVNAADMDIPSRALPEHFRNDGHFRWPYGVTIRRSWRVIDSETNDNLIHDHADKKLQGAAFIHEMRPEEVTHFLNLRVQEISDTPSQYEIFKISRRRPWHQKTGRRSGTNVNPGTELYIAWITDDHGMTVKVGSGKADQRLSALNQYRRGSQGENLWSLADGLLHNFPSVAQARDAEDYILDKAKNEGYGSVDHTEFLKGIDLKRLKELFGEAVQSAHGN